MEAMKWTEQLSVKVELFDNEHKKLIELINKLHNAMYNGEGHSALKAILTELTDYTVYHFKHEEEALQKCNFPGLAGHKKQHEEFVNKVTETKKKYDEGNLMLSIPTIDFLTSWIKNHIMKSDFAYSDLMHKAGIK